MSSDDESRRRRQAFQGAISPARVGTSVTNQVSPDTLQNLLDTDITGQSLQEADIDLADFADQASPLDWRDSSARFPSLEAYAATLGIGSQTQNSPRSMSASHINVPSAGGSRNATDVGSVQGNRRSRRPRSRSRSPIRSSTPRASVPGAMGGRARRGRGPRVRGGLTRGSPRSPRSATPSHHSSNHSSRSATPSHHSSNHSSRSATPSHHSSNHSSRRATPAHHPLTQADLQDRLRAIYQDHDQLAQGREIKNITVTNSVVTSYKQGGRPTVRTNSTRVSP